MGFMVLSTIAFVLMHGSIRQVGDGLHPFEIAFFRNLFAVLPLMPWFVRYGMQPLRTERASLHFMRGLLNVFAMLTFFSALTLIPLAQVTALSFTAPLFGTVLAVVFLREVVRVRRIVALVAGFVGAIVILRPGLVGIETGSLLVLFSAVAWSVTMIVIKVLSRTESSVTITAYMAIFMTPLTLLPALFYWRWPDGEQLVWLVAIGILGSLGQLSVAQAFREAEASVVMPLDFMKLLWAALLGYLAFAEVPDVWVGAGGTMIAASASYIAYRESRLKRVAAAPAPAPPG
jgi:drug/metabolite transporter (DMT)-like permease